MNLDTPITVDGYDEISLRHLIVLAFIAERQPFVELGVQDAARYIRALEATFKSEQGEGA